MWQAFIFPRLGLKIKLINNFKVKIISIVSKIKSCCCYENIIIDCNLFLSFYNLIRKMSNEIGIISMDLCMLVIASHRKINL